jgi:hypothetical protein
MEILSLYSGKIYQEYIDLQEAYYLSYLVSPPLAAYMKIRMAEADALQRVADPKEFQKRFQEFLKNWDCMKWLPKSEIFPRPVSIME